MYFRRQLLLTYTDTCSINQKCRFFKSLNVSAIVILSGVNGIGTLAFFHSPECDDIPTVELSHFEDLIAAASDPDQIVNITLTAGISSEYIPFIFLI